MRIGMLAPISWRTPPRHYGPWELVTSLLTEALVARGVDVTLFATQDSWTAGKLAGVCPAPYSEDPAIDAKVWEMLHVAHVFERRSRLPRRARRGELRLQHREIGFRALFDICRIGEDRWSGPGSACKIEHRKSQEHREQEQRDRRNVTRAAAVDVLAGQLARPPGEERQAPPELAFEMEYAVEQVVEEGAKRAVDVRRLAASVAMAADQLRSAIEASALMRMPSALARSGLDRDGGKHCRRQIAQALRNVVHAVLLTPS